MPMILRQSGLTISLRHHSSFEKEYQAYFLLVGKSSNHERNCVDLRRMCNEFKRLSPPQSSLKVFAYFLNLNLSAYLMLSHIFRNSFKEWSPINVSKLKDMNKGKIRVVKTKLCVF